MHEKLVVNEDVKMLKSRDALAYPVFAEVCFGTQGFRTSVNQAHFRICVNVEVLGTLFVPCLTFPPWLSSLREDHGRNN